MKYIIAGKSLVAGTTRSDSGKMNEYFELGWETVGSRFDVIKLFNDGEINTEDTTIVTTPDRMFFYTKFFNNVITWNEYWDIRSNDPMVVLNTDDWTSKHLTLGFCQSDFATSNGEYYRKEQDGELIFNGWDIDDAQYNPEKPFLVLNIRKRLWCPNRNSDSNLYQDIISKFRGDLDVYVVGRGNEAFCSMMGCTYVDRLKDYVSLIKNKNCVSLISQATGTVAIAMTCATTDIHMIDPSGAGKVTGTNAVLGGTPIHFFTKQLHTYKLDNWKNKSHPEYHQLISRVRKNLEFI